MKISTNILTVGFMALENIADEMKLNVFRGWEKEMK